MVRILIVTLLLVATAYAMPQQGGGGGGSPPAGGNQQLCYNQPPGATTPKCSEVIENCNKCQSQGGSQAGPASSLPGFGQFQTSFSCGNIKVPCDNAENAMVTSTAKPT